MFRIGISIAALVIPMTFGLTACPAPAGAGEGEGEGEGAAGEGEGEGVGGEGEGEGEGVGGEGEGEGVGGEGEGEGAAGYNCTTGAVFTGNTEDPNPTARPAAGQSAFAAPFAPYGKVLFSGTTIIFHDQLVVWSFDGTNPNATLNKIAGDEPADANNSTEALITGTCAASRFAIINDIALTSTGDIIVADPGANAVLKISHPLDAANCTVSHVAGTADDQQAGTFGGAQPPPAENLTGTVAGTTQDAPADGAVATATFSGPDFVVVDSSDNIYVRDGRRDLGGSDFIRKIAGGQVTTVAKSVTDNGVLGGMTIKNDKIFLWSTDSVTLSLAEFDPAAATPATLRCHSTVQNLAGGGCPTNASDNGLGDCICNSGFGAADDGTFTSCVAGTCTDLLRGDQTILSGTGGGSVDVGGIAPVNNGFIVWLTGGLWFVPEATPANNTQVAGEFGVATYDSDPTYDPTVSHDALNTITEFSTGRSEELGEVADVSVDATGNIYVSTQFQGSAITKFTCTE